MASRCCGVLGGSRRPRRSTRSGLRSASPKSAGRAEAAWCLGSQSGSSRACSWRPWPGGRHDARGAGRGLDHATRAPVAPRQPGRAGGAGDLVAFEAGVILGGYVGELGRTRRRAMLFHRPGLPGGGTTCGTGSSTRAGRSAAARPPRRVRQNWDALPPMPVARGLGLGYDLPLVTAGCQEPPPKSSSRRAWCWR